MNAKTLKAYRTAALVAVLAAFAATLALRIGFLGHLEDVTRDIRVATAAPMPQQKDIVIAGLTEETVTQFAYRSPVDREFLANLIKTLEAKGARQIGVDVLFDQPTEPAKDELLKKTIRETKTPLLLES